VAIRLVGTYDSATTICAKTFTTYVKVTVPAANVLVTDVFGTVLFRDISCHKTGTPPFSYV
jgi:hypothetical protein